MKRFFRKVLIWLVRVAAVLIVVLIILYAEEDWHGARDWAACQKELQAKGESLDLRQLAPAGKPEDDLSKIPLFSELYEEYQSSLKVKQSSGGLIIDPVYNGGHKEARIHRLDADFGSPDRNQFPRYQNYLKGEPVDLAAWQKFYRSNRDVKMVGTAGTPAQDVLLALSQFDDELKEIDGAVSNPNAYWPVNYEMPASGYLGGITSTIKIARALQIRAVAHLENHETDLAQKDLTFCLRLNQPLTKCFFFVNYLVMSANQNYAHEILWEGLHRHSWSDVQLREIESALASTDMLVLAAKSLRTERASMLQTTHYVQTRNPKLLAEWDLEDDPGVAFLLYTGFIRPSGWWDQDRSRYSLGIQKLIEALYPDRGTIDTTAFAPEDVEFQKSLWGSFYTPVSEIALPIDRRLGPKIAKAETYRRLARLACRLEEYRLAHGQYPDKLDDLPDLPTLLNQEVPSEQPLRYQCKGDGYLLYSIGWNQKDDGGVRATDDREGDWPWPSP